MAVPPYVYQAKILGIHDGDTVQVSVRLAPTRAKPRDLGFHVFIEDGFIVLHAAIRFLGTNSPELWTVEGRAARDYLMSLVKIDDIVTLRSSVPAQDVGTDKYGGRWDGVLVRKDGLVLNDEMVRAGHAKPWGGQGAKPV